MLSMTQRTPSPQLSAEVETSCFGTKGTGRLHHIKLCSVKSWMVSFSGMCSSVYLFALLMLILQTTWAGAKPVQCFNFGSVRWLFTHSLMFRAETGMFRVFNNVGTEQSQAEQNIPQSIRGRESPIQDWSAMKMSLFGFSQQYTQSSFMC